MAVQNAAPIHQMGIATSGSQFFRQIGSTVGIAIFGTVLTHNLVQELPQRLPEVPGLSAEKIDLGHMQARAMKPDNLRKEIDGVVMAQYEIIERAYRGDAAAAADVSRNPRLPEALRNRVQAAADLGEPSTPEAKQAVESQLTGIKQALTAYSAELTKKFERGIKEGFSSAIVSMLQGALWIVALGLLITLFVPVLPLRDYTAMSAPPSDKKAA